MFKNIGIQGDWVGLTFFGVACAVKFAVDGDWVMLGGALFCWRWAVVDGCEMEP